MNLKAKTIVPEQFWLIVNENGKVGNIQNIGSHYQVMIHTRALEFSSKADIEEKLDLELDTEAPKPVSEKVSDYPINGEAYNSILDIRRNLHLFTKTPDSKCYYAAGWFALCEDEQWSVVQCPKYIYLQRREYMGPYHSESEAHTKLANK